MFGAIIGDIVGSKYEFNWIKSKDFPLFSKGCDYTDDTLMTVAVANALIKSLEDELYFKTVLIEEMQEMGRKYPHPSGGYGAGFSYWLKSENPQPYNSFGNGSAMRVSPCGYIATSIGEAISLAKVSAEITHNHPEGIKGAQAVAGVIYLANNGASKKEIKDFIYTNFYDLDKSLDEIRPSYYFNEICQETVPQAIQAFLESDSFEDAIRNAISLGGDSDTLGAITGSIAWAFYNYNDISRENQSILDTALSYLPDDIKEIIDKFDIVCTERIEAYNKTGACSIIK